jgi:hypothetical protein
LVEVEFKSAMKSNKFLGLLFWCLSGICFFSQAVGQVQAAGPPGWVLNRPNDPDIYFGIGTVPTDKDDIATAEEKKEAYNLAVTELSQMAGQIIYSSFKDYQKEVSGNRQESVAEQEVVSSVEIISEQFLQGIQIRDEWQDEKGKAYHVFVVIDRDDANRQIKANVKGREIKLAKVIDAGINRLDRQMEKMKADMGQMDAKVKDVDQRVSQTSEDVSELFDQMQFVKDQIETLSSGEMNWSKHLMRVKGIGAANPNFPAAIQKASAERAAQMDAQAKLVEFANGLKMESKTFMKNYQIEADVKVKEVKGTLRGAYQVGKTIYHDDGTAEVVMEADVKKVFP